MQFPDSDFWDFSISFYMQPEVEKICIELQNKYEFDINIILFVFWLAAEKNTVLTTDKWQLLLTVSLPWQEIIKPLRKSRALLKDSTIAWPADFQYETKDSIGQIEINAEHIQQLAMEKSFTDMDISITSLPLDKQIRNNFIHLLDAYNSDISIEMIEAEINSLLDVFHNNQDSKKIIA